MMTLLRGEGLEALPRKGTIRVNGQHAVVIGSVTAPPESVVYTQAEEDTGIADKWLKAGKSRLDSLHLEHQFKFPWPTSAKREACEAWATATSAVEELEDALEELKAEYLEKKTALDKALESAQQNLQKATSDIVLTHGRGRVVVDGVEYDISMGKTGKNIFLAQHKKNAVEKRNEGDRK